HVASLVVKHDHLLVLRTFSKYYALAGVRIGFAVVGKKLERLAKFASRYLGYNRISEQLALAALDSPGYYLQIAENIRVDRQKYVDFFSQFNGFQCYRSEANFLLVRIPGELKSPLQEYLRQNGIAIKFFSDAEFANHMRITIGTVNQNRRLLKLLDEFLRVWKDYGVPA
ncbi:MAG: Histidinol-phosphate transaminase, partial [Bacteroidetes bacterium]|nr:Histidinol-phosphate transaminase [Bacteroidota bacterium]